VVHIVWLSEVFDLCCGFIVLVPVALKPAASRPGVPPLMRAPSGSGVGISRFGSRLTPVYAFVVGQSVMMQFCFGSSSVMMQLWFGSSS
jgi:hypothetical protein